MRVFPEALTKDAPPKLGGCKFASATFCTEQAWKFNTNCEKFHSAQCSWWFQGRHLAAELLFERLLKESGDAMQTSDCKFNVAAKFANELNYAGACVQMSRASRNCTWNIWFHATDQEQPWTVLHRSRNCSQLRVSLPFFFYLPLHSSVAVQLASIKKFIK